jgi:hypothetical protein
MFIQLRRRPAHAPRRARQLAWPSTSTSPSTLCCACRVRLRWRNCGSANTSRSSYRLARMARPPRSAGRATRPLPPRVIALIASCNLARFSIDRRWWRSPHQSRVAPHRSPCRSADRSPRRMRRYSYGRRRSGTRRSGCWSDGRCRPSPEPRVRSASAPPGSPPWRSVPQADCCAPTAAHRAENAGRQIRHRNAYAHRTPAQAAR